MPSKSTPTSQRTRQRTRPTGDAPLRAVAFLRLSRKKRTTGDTNLSLEAQQASCERAITALGGTLVAVEQDMQSGDRLDRPGLWNAITRIETGLQQPRMSTICKFAAGLGIPPEDLTGWNGDANDQMGNAAA